MSLTQFVPAQKYFEYEYLGAILRMLPMGALWDKLLHTLPTNPDDARGNTFTTFLSVIATELAYVEEFIQYFWTESIPGLSTDMLSDWERVAGIPEPGTTLASSIAERRSLVHTKLNSPDEKIVKPWYVTYAENLGFNIRISEYTEISKPFYVAPIGVDPYDLGARVGDRLNSKGQIGTILIEVYGGLAGTEQMQAIFEIKKPAHCVFVWQELIINRSIIFNFDLYTFAVPGIGNLTNEVDTDSELYAENHAELLAQYGLRELVSIFDDDYAGKRPTNVAYTKGPDDMAMDSVSFDNDWAFYSPMTTSGSVIAYNITTDTEYSMAVYFPSYAADFTGPIGILSGCFDMSGSPVLAWETAVDEITTFRVNEGKTLFTGYSPLVICNQPYVQDENQESLLFDSIIIYTKDLSGTTEWNYDSITTPLNQIETDTRYGDTLYARFQRNNFGIEYTLCTLGIDIAYIENAWFTGDPNDVTFPDDFNKEFYLYISVRDTDKVRHTIRTAPFFTYNFLELNADSAAMAASVNSGELFETLTTEDIGSDSSAMSAAINSGALENVSSDISNTETVAMSVAITGVLFDTTITPAQQTESKTMSAAINSGLIETATVAGGSNTETASMTAAINSGSLTTP